jgi:hypothetical protein
MLTTWKRWRPRIAGAIPRLAALDVTDALALLLIGVGAVALLGAIMTRGFDYDELEHAHAAWLVRNGVEPFNEFFECHPPFIWYPLSLFFWFFGDSYNLLFVFRLIAAIGQVAFMVALFKNVALSLRELPTPAGLPVRVGAIAAAFVALHPAVFEYLLEFRIDSWPNAVLAIAIYRYRLRRSDALRASIELAALSIAAVLCSPKLIVFATLFAFASLLVDDRRLVRLGGMVAGGAAALGLGAGLLLIAGLEPIGVYRLSLEYHHVLNTKGGFGRGLYEMVNAQPVMRNVLIASVVAWLIVVRRRIHRAAFEIAVLVFLAAQLKLVSFGYKQYYAPWFLLGAAFLPYLEVLWRPVRPLHSLLLAAALAYSSVNAFEVYRGYENRVPLAMDIKGRQDLDALVPRDGFVVSMVDTMGTFRRNALYQAVTSYARNEFDGTRIMQELKVDPYSQEFTTERASADLEAHPPDVIVLGAGFPPYVRRAIDEYVAKHAAQFTRMNGHFGEMLVRKR